MRPRLAHIVAAAWGFAEAAVFFIVPDVWLSILALERPKRALRACLFATAGAVAGGLLVYFIGRAYPVSLEALYLSLPGINEGLMARVHSELVTHGQLGLFLGPLSGTPYKLYALQSGQLGLAVSAFALVSIPARLLRFFVITGATVLISRSLESRVSLRQRQVLLLLAWGGFYAWYFSVMG